MCKNYRRSSVLWSSCDGCLNFSKLLYCGHVELWTSQFHRAVLFIVIHCECLCVCAPVLYMGRFQQHTTVQIDGCSWAESGLMLREAGLNGTQWTYSPSGISVPRWPPGTRIRTAQSKNAGLSWLVSNRGMWTSLSPECSGSSPEVFPFGLPGAHAAGSVCSVHTCQFCKMEDQIHRL